jgi:ATP-binding cassette subfamily F protein uup
VVHVGTKLEVAYFDQLRNQLDDEKTVIENIAHGSDFIEINGERKHASATYKTFCFRHNAHVHLLKPYRVVSVIGSY